MWKVGLRTDALGGDNWDAFWLAGKAEKLFVACGLTFHHGSEMLIFVTDEHDLPKILFWMVCIPKTPSSGFPSNVTLLLPGRLLNPGQVPFLHVADFKGIRRGWSLRDTRLDPRGPVGGITFPMTCRGKIVPSAQTFRDFRRAQLIRSLVSRSSQNRIVQLLGDFEDHCSLAQPTRDVGDPQRDLVSA